MAGDPRDYKLDISSKSGFSGNETVQSAAIGGGRAYLSIHFACCSVYTRIYRDADGNHYQGRCPRCGQNIQFRVGEGGTNSRCFVIR
jgi:hypothetical protein